MLIITFVTEEICELLEVSKEGLKSIIKRKKLEDRLLAKGYVLVDKYKCGRDNIYEIRPINSVEEKWDSIQKQYKIPKDKEEMHNTYSETRIENLRIPRTEVIDKSETDISYKTAKRYDDILIKEKLMDNDKTVYYLFNLKTKEREREISKEEYKAFWILNAEFKKRVKGLRYKVKNYIISNSQYDILIASAYEEFGHTSDYIAIKFDTYKELEETQNILKQIKEKREKDK